MSPRTILLFAATVFVLLAIPGIYLACTWSTHNPLRFEVTRLEISGHSPIVLADMEVSVRNTSNLPVYLDPPEIQATDHTGHTGRVLASLFLRLGEDSHASFSEPLYLPPGGSVPCTLNIASEMDMGKFRKYLKTVEVDYYWRSGTMEKVSKLYDRWVYQGPEALRKFIPRPKDSHHRARLELPATTSP